jgi:hypothetical protein
VFCGELEPVRHRALHLGFLHAESDGLVELTPGTRPPSGKVEIDRRTRPEHFLPGGATGRVGWLDGLLEHARRIVAGDYARQRFGGQPREEAFVGVTPRTRPRGSKDAVAYTRFLWVDVDRPERLPALWAFLAERPCHVLIESAVIRSRCSGDRCASEDEGWRHVADARISLTLASTRTTYDMYDLSALLPLICVPVRPKRTSGPR